MAIRVLVDEQSFIDEKATEWQVDPHGYLRLYDADHAVTSVFAPGWTTAGRWVRDSASPVTTRVQPIDPPGATDRAVSLATRV